MIIKYVAWPNVIGFVAISVMVMHWDRPATLVMGAGLVCLAFVLKRRAHLPKAK